MSLISLGSSRNLKMPFLSYGGGRVDPGSVVRGLGVGLSLEAILMIVLLGIDAVM
jgi:hypothetical protein